MKNNFVSGFILGLSCLALMGAVYTSGGGSLGNTTVSGVEFSRQVDSLQQPFFQIDNTGSGDTSNLELIGSQGADPGMIFTRVNGFQSAIIEFDVVNDDLQFHHLSASHPTMRMDNNGNILIFNNNTNAEQMLLFARGAIQLNNFGTELTPAPGAIVLKSTDVAGSSEFFVEDEAGNITQLSPHNANGDWVFFSYNQKTGDVEYLEFKSLITEVERLSGKSLMKKTKEDVPAEYSNLITRLENSDKVQYKR